MDVFQIDRPDHLDDRAWAAVEAARVRLKAAWDLRDLPEVIGKAKELVETVAKVVVASVEGAVTDASDFAPTVKAAHRSLKRQPGPDLAHDEQVRAIAQGVQTVATSIGDLRNRYGTGHGRARIPVVADEMATLCLESALMWTRWALRRLGHLLADYPNDLIEAVQIGTSRAELHTKFEAATLAQQPDEIQYRIGVVFGQQTAGGYGNAKEVGVAPAIDGGFDDYPLAYRSGLMEGMLLTGGGSIGLTDYYAQWFVSLLASLPEKDAQEVMERLSEDVASASWIATWRGSSPVEPHEVLAALDAESGRLPPTHAQAFQGFRDGLSAAAGRSEPVAATD